MSSPLDIFRALSSCHVDLNFDRLGVGQPPLLVPVRQQLICLATRLLLQELHCNGLSRQPKPVLAPESIQPKPVLAPESI
jgi:hypothetical protein